jgi:topoisomerase-4 subunit B
VIPLFEGEGAMPTAKGTTALPKARAPPGPWPSPKTAQPVRESYVNLIPTSAGGTHESGLRDGVFNAVKSFIELHSLLPKGVKLLPEDVFARASATC